MGVFFSPKTLVGLLINKDSIVKELNAYNTDWYFSKEGENAYKNAKTQAQRTAFFFNYVSVASKTKFDRDDLYKLAYVMANSMVSSSLSFGGYPNVIDPKKNPLIEYITRESPYKSTYSSNYNYPINGTTLLLWLRNGYKKEASSEPKRNPYSDLICEEDDGSLSEMYIIERDIVGAFCASGTKKDPYGIQSTDDNKYMSPYKYDIVKALIAELNNGDQEGSNDE